MIKRTILVVLVLAIGLGVLGVQESRAEPSEERTQVSLRESDDLRPLDRFVLGTILGNDSEVQRALVENSWPLHLRLWARARFHLAQADSAAARIALEAAAEAWPEDRAEPARVLSAFDAMRMQLAINAGDLDAAQTLRSLPLRYHGDAVWAAWAGRLALAEGRPSVAAWRLDAAWKKASRLERSHPVFFYRALAHLESGSEPAAAQAWVDCLALLRRPELLRESARVYDAHPQLRELCDRDGLREPVLTWLVRLLRRDEAFEWARDAWSIAEPEEGRRLFVFAAEQLYRKRRHDDLHQFLAGERPTGLSSEQLAELEAYPWGVARRSGHSTEIAEGFEAVAARYSGVPRAAEATWEAAWMWELSGETERAVDAFRRYVDMTEQGRLRASAALRTLLLPAREGDVDTVLNSYEGMKPALGEGMQQAAALHIMAYVASSRGEDASAREWLTQLEREHPASPLWREVPAAGTRGRDTGWGVVKSLHDRQHRAFKRVGRELGIASLATGDAELKGDLGAASRFAELGMATEAESLLQSIGDQDRGDDLTRFWVVYLAWKWSLPETQGRHAWWLERRLSGKSEALDQALWSIALPTPYASTVLSLSASLDISPSLVWAISRRESFFDADVVSLAGAYGLMQLLPTTATRIATEADLELPGLSDLFRPSTNLGLGSRYISSLLEEFDGVLVDALAAYNAGEGNAGRWRDRRHPEDPEAWAMLQVSYSETRSYIYNVLRISILYEDHFPMLRSH